MLEWILMYSKLFGPLVSETSLKVVQKTFSSISAGNFHTCGLTLGMNVWCWGRVTQYGLGPSVLVASILQLLRELNFCPRTSHMEISEMMSLIFRLELPNSWECHCVSLWWHSCLCAWCQQEGRPLTVDAVEWEPFWINRCHKWTQILPWNRALHFLHAEVHTRSHMFGCKFCSRQYAGEAIKWVKQQSPWTVPQCRWKLNDKHIIFVLATIQDELQGLWSWNLPMILLTSWKRIQGLVASTLDGEHTFAAAGPTGSADAIHRWLYGAQTDFPKHHDGVVPSDVVVISRANLQLASGLRHPLSFSSCSHFSISLSIHLPIFDLFWLVFCCRARSRSKDILFPEFALTDTPTSAAKGAQQKASVFARKHGLVLACSGNICQQPRKLRLTFERIDGTEAGRAYFSSLVIVYVQFWCLQNQCCFAGPIFAAHHQVSWFLERAHHKSDTDFCLRFDAVEWHPTWSLTFESQLWTLHKAGSCVRKFQFILIF